MISKFGYKKGQGLGKHRQGRAKPIEVRKRPLNEGLGYAEESTDENNPMFCCTHYQKFEHDVKHCWERHPELTSEWFQTCQGKQAARASSDANSES